MPVDGGVTTSNDRYSAFKQIEEESAKLLEKSTATRFTDKREDLKLVTALVERLRETITCYQVGCRHLLVSIHVHEGRRYRNSRLSTIE